MSIKPVNTENVIFKINDKKKWDIENDIEIRNYYVKLLLLSQTVFKWKGLPEDIDEMFLERILWEQGSILFFKDEDQLNEKGEEVYMTLQAVYSGGFTVYRIPKVRRAYSVSGFNKTFTNKDSVIIYDNPLKMSLESIIYQYAKRLAKVERIIDVNLEHTRHPYIIATDEKQKELIEQVFEDINNNKPYIIADEGFADTILKRSEVLNLNSPLVIDKLMDYKTTLWNEALTFIGIGNSSQDKRERLVSKEMDIVGMQNDAFSNIRLKARMQACDEINRMFGTNISVELVDGVRENVEESEDDEDGTENDIT